MFEFLLISRIFSISEICDLKSWSSCSVRGFIQTVISEGELSVAHIFSGAVFPGDRNTISAGRKPGHMDKE